MSYPFAQNEKEMKAYLQALVDDVESLVVKTEKDTSAHVISARNKLKINIATMKYKIHLLEESIREKAKATDEYVHENPWKSIGIVSATTLGIGFILGFLVGHKD